MVKNNEYVTGVAENETAIKKISKQINNLKVPFIEIRDRWYRDNEKLFESVSGPGYYEDYKKPLTPRASGVSAYVERKRRELGSEYPMLVYTGKLSYSILAPGREGGIEIMTEKELTLGTDIDYAEYLQDGTPYMVARPMVMNEEVEGIFESMFEERAFVYTEIIRKYVNNVVQQEYGYAV
jgi:hypothetical protein